MRATTHKSVVFLLILGPILLFILNVFSPSIPVKADPLYQRAITITNSSGTAQTDYQINIFLNTATLVSAGKMRSDCGDIRFKDSNQTSDINYFIESDCNTTNTSIWVKKPTLPTGNSFIYLQYGDLTFTSTSTASGTLVIFEDMLSAPSCTLQNNAIYDATNNWVRLTSTAAGVAGQCNYTYTPGAGFYAKFEFWAGGGNGADATWLYAYHRVLPFTEDIVNRGYSFTFDEYQNRICFTKSITDNGAGLSCGTNTTIDNSAWRVGEVYTHNRFGRVLMDSVQYVNHTDIVNQNKVGTFFGFAARSGGQNNEHRLRKLLVTNWAPNITFVIAQETNLATSLSFAIRNSADTANLNSCDLGTVTNAQVASCSYRLKVSTNAASGYTISVGTSGNLTIGAYGINNALVGPTGSNISNTSLNIENYGVRVDAGSISSGTISTTTTFNSSPNASRFNYISAQNLLVATGQNSPSGTDTARTSLVVHLLNVTPATPAGIYTQNIAYTILPNF